MNCMEARALVEDALDKSLAGSRRRALDLHLSRCDACRAFFSAEQAEHRRWFLAMNEPAARRRLPQGFAEGFLAEVAERHAMPQRRWAFLAKFRRVAAALVAMAVFAGLVYAATVIVGGDGISDSAAATSASDVSDDVPPVASVSSAEGQPSADNQLKGEKEMNIKQKAATALAAAMLATPSSAGMGATYTTGNAPLASGEVNLRTVAVEDGSGNLVVLWNGNTSWWSGNQYTAFDGATDAPYNPRSVSSATWTGYELTVPRVVTRIRFCAPGSTDNPSRLRVCQVEGANQPDFSDAVLLLECKHVVPVNWVTGSPYWFEAPARSFTTPQTFRYIRFIQPRGASEPNTFCGNVTEVEFYGMDTESYASYTPTAAKESNLRLYAIHETTGALDILSDKTTPYASGYDYSKSLDENTSTFYDAPNNTTLGHYVGYALAAPMAVTRIRYYGRPSAEYWPRIFYCRIEGANQADFSDAVTLHNCADSAPADWYQHPDWIEVGTDAVAGLNTFRYLRFVDPSGTHQCGNVAEVEFYGMDADALASNVLANLLPPTDVTTSRDDFPQGGTVLRWKVQSGVSESSVLRSFGAGGPWTEVAQVSGTTTWTDTTAPAGAIMYYRLVSRFSYNGESAAITNDAAVSARRWRLLERDPSDMSHVRSGVSVVYKSGTGYWTGGSLAGSAALAFDNKWPPSTSGNYPDMAQGSPRTCIGVDLSERAHLALVRFYAGRSDYASRMNGVVFAGSNENDWYNDGKFETLTSPLQFDSVGWYDLESANTENGYRYLFCYNPSNNGWNNNASELQFYGWLESDLSALATVAQGVSGVVGTCGTTPSVTLSWTPASSYGTFAIERKVGNGEWAEVANGISGATWADTDVVCDGTTYAYRVKTVNGGGFAYSETYSIAPYIVGNGIGLHGVWSSPYSSTNIGESVVSVETNAVIDFANVSVGGSTTGFSVRWTGKLIAPTSAEYLFDAEADDTVALWIDGTPILYRNTKSGTSQSAPDGAVTLAAGEHDIVMTWFQDDGDNLCRLYWRGPFDRCIVPTSQLVPVPSELPEGWAGARTFSNAASVSYPGDVRFNGDGTIDLAYGGADLYLSENGYNLLWQPMSGNFVCHARVESLNLSGTQGKPQKGGLMVRAALDSGSPFEACMLKWENGTGTDGVKLRLGSKRCASRGTRPIDGRDIISDQAAWKIAVTGRAGWIRLRREGNVFTYSYRSDGESVWTPIYRLVDTEGVYGDTVYVGLASSGSAATQSANVPRFDWRFSNVSLRQIAGAILILR